MLPEFILRSANFLALGAMVTKTAPRKAKATTILNYFGLSDKDLQYTVDDNSLKQNKFIPGTDIQIKNIEDIKPNSYDYVLVLAWNFFDSIKKNNKKIFSNSKFIKLK